MEGMTGEKLNMLREALIGLGYYVHKGEYAGFEECNLVADHFANRTSVRVTGGRVTVSIAGDGETLARATEQVKKSYAALVVESALKKFGWQSTKSTAGVIRATRRY